MVELVERLIGKGYDLRIYDSNVRMAAIHGANREYILNHIPHISKLMVASIDEVLEHAGTIVIGNGSPEFRDIPPQLRGGQLDRRPGAHRRHAQRRGRVRRDLLVSDEEDDAVKTPSAS